MLGLKVEIDRFAKSNKEFKEENVLLRTEVDKLSKAEMELSAVQQRLEQTSVQYAENIDKFRKLDERLTKLSDDNIAGFEKLQKMSVNVQDSIKKELLQHERG